MSKPRYCFGISFPVTFMVFACSLSHSKLVESDESIVLPNPKMFGKQIGTVLPLVKYADGKQAIYPKNIHLDLNGPIIYGVMATYPDSVSFQNLVDRINLTHKKWSRDPDGEMAKWGVTVWRNDKGRYSIQASESKIIMIWLDRKITQEEVNEVTKVLFEDAMKRVLEAQEKTLSDERKNGKGN